MGMRPHAKRAFEKRKQQRETEGREYRREVQESATQVVWSRREARLRLRGKKERKKERLWRGYHPGEESEEDRSRDGWTVSTET